MGVDGRRTMISVKKWRYIHVDRVGIAGKNAVK